MLMFHFADIRECTAPHQYHIRSNSEMDCSYW